MSLQNIHPIIEAVFAQIGGVLNEELVKKTNAVFSFSLSDKNTQYFLDMKVVMTMMMTRILTTFLT